mmetsp:Transcript_66610/g.182684  ORF Transcript_66610/g.182684 Transcript_66610/m.182684 type:complete len:202 (-) Transcript_66610:360-965(-)
MLKDGLDHLHVLLVFGRLHCMVEDRHLRAALRERVGAALEEKVDELVVVALGRVEDGRLARLVLHVDVKFGGVLELGRCAVRDHVADLVLEAVASHLHEGRLALLVVLGVDERRRQLLPLDELFDLAQLVGLARHHEWQPLVDLVAVLLVRYLRGHSNGGDAEVEPRLLGTDGLGHLLELHRLAPARRLFLQLLEHLIKQE